MLRIYIALPRTLTIVVFLNFFFGQFSDVRGGKGHDCQPLEEHEESVEGGSLSKRLSLSMPLTENQTLSWEKVPPGHVILNCTQEINGCGYGNKKYTLKKYGEGTYEARINTLNYDDAGKHYWKIMNDKRETICDILQLDLKVKRDEAPTCKTVLMWQTGEVRLSCEWRHHGTDDIIEQVSIITGDFITYGLSGVGYCSKSNINIRLDFEDLFLERDLPNTCVVTRQAANKTCHFIAVKKADIKITDENGNKNVTFNHTKEQSMTWLYTRYTRGIPLNFSIKHKIQRDTLITAFFSTDNIGTTKEVNLSGIGIFLMKPKPYHQIIEYVAPATVLVTEQQNISEIGGQLCTCVHMNDSQDQDNVSLVDEPLDANVSRSKFVCNDDVNKPRCQVSVRTTSSGLEGIADNKKPLDGHTAAIYSIAIVTALALVLSVSAVCAILRRRKLTECEQNMRHKYKNNPEIGSLISGNVIVEELGMALVPSPPPARTLGLMSHHELLEWKNNSKADLPGEAYHRPKLAVRQYPVPCTLCDGESETAGGHNREFINEGIVGNRSRNMYRDDDATPNVLETIYSTVDDVKGKSRSASSAPFISHPPTTCTKVEHEEHVVKRDGSAVGQGNLAPVKVFGDSKFINSPTPSTTLDSVHMLSADDSCVSNESNTYDKLQRPLITKIICFGEENDSPSQLQRSIPDGEIKDNLCDYYASPNNLVISDNQASSKVSGNIGVDLSESSKSSAIQNTPLSDIGHEPEAGNDVYLFPIKGIKAAMNNESLHCDDLLLLTTESHNDETHSSIDAFSVQRLCRSMSGTNENLTVSDAIVKSSTNIITEDTSATAE